MAKRAGRKIYRTNSMNRKRRTKKAFVVFLILIIAAAVIFVGYSITGTVVNYIRNNGQTEDGTIVPWTPPVAADESGGSDAPESPGQENTGDNGGSPDTEKKYEVRFSAYKLPVSALTSAGALGDALNTAKENGYTAVIAVLKDKGGRIYYKTMSDMAKSDEMAVAGDMYAGQICAMIKAAGFTPIAQINLLEDNNRYGEARNGSYHFAGDNSTWLDNSVANGGKPWLSPFDTVTQSYAAYLSNEISTAGFEYVIFDGVTFPPFRNSDLNHIGDIVKSPDRYKALVNIANISAGAAEQNDTASIVMLSAADIIAGTSEAFKPSELNSHFIGVTYFAGDFGGTVVINGEETAFSELSAYDRAEAVFTEVKRLAGENMVIIPAIRQAEFSQADFSDTISAIMAVGCDAYIII